MGTGLSFSLPRADLFVSYLEFVGTDTHTGRAFTAGLSDPFKRSFLCAPWHR